MKLRDLIAAGHIEAADACLSAEAAKGPGQKDPVALLIAVGIASWLSALFVLGFLLMAFEPSKVGAIVLGAVMVAVAVLIHAKADGLPVFFEQGILAAVSAGHLLLLFGIATTWQSGDEAFNLALAQTGLCLIGLLAYKKGIYRVSGLLLAVILWIHTALEMNAPMLYHLLLVTQAVLFAAVALWRAKTSSYILALSVSLLVSIFYLDWMHSHLWEGFLGAPVWPANLCMVVLLGLTCWRVIPGCVDRAAWVAAGLLLLAILSFASTAGILLGLCLIVYGRGSRNRLIEGLGIAGLFASVAYYYYSLQTSLLMKSATMCLSGLVCLLIAAMAYRYVRTHEESGVGQ